MKGIITMTKTKTRPDPDGDKTIGEIVKEVEVLNSIQAYLEGDENI